MWNFSLFQSLSLSVNNEASVYLLTPSYIFSNILQRPPALIDPPPPIPYTHTVVDCVSVPDVEENTRPLLSLFFLNSRRHRHKTTASCCCCCCCLTARGKCPLARFPSKFYFSKMIGSAAVAAVLARAILIYSILDLPDLNI